MPVKIRLARHGKKHHAYYHIVVADSRAPRDGKFIELIGNYDPNTNPATINLDNDKAVSWLSKGAQPTDTCRAILSYKGVMFRNHLQKGVAKGVLTQEQADEKFAAWQDGKSIKISDKKKRLADSAKKQSESRLEAETKKKEAIAELVRKKNTPPPAEEPAAEAPAADAPAADAPAAEAPANDAPSAEGETPAEA
jgi:small subunit ribosomal protein S16